MVDTEVQILPVRIRSSFAEPNAQSLLYRAVLRHYERRAAWPIRAVETLITAGSGFGEHAIIPDEHRTGHELPLHALHIAFAALCGWVNVSQQQIIESERHEVLNHFVIVSERHLNHVCTEAMRWYNTERGHSARDNVPPAWEAPPEEVQTIRRSEVVCTTRLGGLLKHYSRRAA